MERSALAYMHALLVVSVLQAADQGMDSAQQVIDRFQMIHREIVEHKQQMVKLCDEQTRSNFKQYIGRWEGLASVMLYCGNWNPVNTFAKAVITENEDSKGLCALCEAVHELAKNDPDAKEIRKSMRYARFLAVCDDCNEREAYAILSPNAVHLDESLPQCLSCIFWDYVSKDIASFRSTVIKHCLIRFKYEGRIPVCYHCHADIFDMHEIYHDSHAHEIISQEMPKALDGLLNQYTVLNTESRALSSLVLSSKHASILNKLCALYDRQLDEAAQLFLSNAMQVARQKQALQDDKVKGFERSLYMKQVVTKVKRLVDQERQVLARVLQVTSAVCDT